MPAGPEGQKRPGDVVGAAIKVARIATGELVDEVETDTGKNKAAVELGRKGGQSRAKVLSQEQRQEVARKAAHARWRC